MLFRVACPLHSRRLQAYRPRPICPRPQSRVSVSDHGARAAPLLLARRKKREAATSGVAQMQPRQALLREYVPCRQKSRGVAKGADVEMRFNRQAVALAGQRRSALGAKSPPSAGRGIEFGNLTLGNDVRVALECHEDRDRRTAVLAATLAMAPRHRFGLPRGHKAHRAAETATLELIAHDAELSASRSGLPERAWPFDLLRGRIW